MDECQNVIDFEELEKLCSSELQLEGDQDNNIRIKATIDIVPVVIANNQASNNNNNNVVKKETKEIEVQTEAFDPFFEEKDFDNSNTCELLDDISATSSNMVNFSFFLLNLGVKMYVCSMYELNHEMILCSCKKHIKKTGKNSSLLIFLYNFNM